MMSKYLRQPHAVNCDCSVCWSRRALTVSAPSRSAACTLCRPASASKVAGRWLVIPAFICEKHTPSSRPPRYWSECFNTGKPTPFVPIYEPFELE